MTLHPFSTWANGGETGVSLYGALPANPSMSPSADFQPFFFTSLNPTILDSTLIGPNGQPQLYIITDSSLPGYTIFKTVNERNVALVEWSQRHAQVEVRGVVPKQPASQFLRLSRDRRQVSLSSFVFLRSMLMMLG
ncbi:hypothetical protein D9757_005897 [Collybiopsis confluens]|uniref:Uncharacterized protein n=1 Tax=Collybiopsis confluens TaxID=2823264 RepID=A0A8H5MA45_9AGAR|nr:hypothetical protein D9757_005897 [Collybiopsis confluens]